MPVKPYRKPPKPLLAPEVYFSLPFRYQPVGKQEKRMKTFAYVAAAADCMVE
jgi:hypothetical protein